MSEDLESKVLRIVKDWNGGISAYKISLLLNKANMVEVRDALRSLQEQGLIHLELKETQEYFVAGPPEELQSEDCDRSSILSPAPITDAVPGSKHPGKQDLRCPHKDCSYVGEDEAGLHKHMSRAHNDRSWKKALKDAELHCPVDGCETVSTGRFARPSMITHLVKKHGMTREQAKRALGNTLRQEEEKKPTEETAVDPGTEQGPSVEHTAPMEGTVEVTAICELPEASAVEQLPVTEDHPEEDVFDRMFHHCRDIERRAHREGYEVNVQLGRRDVYSGKRANYSAKIEFEASEGTS